MVVEIISPSSTGRDWTTKRDLYARHGVKEYWLIDPINRTLWVMRLRDRIPGTYGYVQGRRYGDRFHYQKASQSTSATYSKAWVGRR